MFWETEYLFDEKVTTEFAKKVFSIINTNGSDLLKYTNKLIENYKLSPVTESVEYDDYMKAVNKFNYLDWVYEGVHIIC